MDTTDLAPVEVRLTGAVVPHAVSALSASSAAAAILTMARTVPSTDCYVEPARHASSGPTGAHARIRTGDLLLTKEMLYRLSYVGGAVQAILSAPYWPPS